MEWIIGLFIFWLIAKLLGSSSKSQSDSTTTKNDEPKRTDNEPLKDLLKRGENLLNILNTESKLNNNKKPASKKIVFKDKKNFPKIAVSSPGTQRGLVEEPPPHDEIPPWLQDNKYSGIADSFKIYGISSIWHMTHRNNIKEILGSGILSNKAAYTIKEPTDISDHRVQRRRESEDPIYGRKLHDYAPTYINIRNPMLYKRRDIQHELCLIEISLSALSETNFLLTDGNAAARNTHFYNTTNDLDKLPWDVLKAPYWNDFPDGKRKRCSEVLIYPKIDSKHIIKLHFCSSVTLRHLPPFDVPVKISEKLFF